MPTTAAKFDDLRDSHAEAELFINSVPSILVGLDPRGYIKRWNSAAANVFGLSAEEVRGKSLTSCGIEWLLPEIDATIQELLQTKCRVSWDGVTFRRGGETRLLGLTVDWITLPRGGDGELLIVGADITERRRSECELRSKTAFLEAQVHATIDGILVVDEDSKIVLRNDRFLELFEIPRELHDANHDGDLLRHVLEMLDDPGGFLEKVKDLYIHRTETSRDEIAFKNGTVLDRYSAPVFGKDKTYYGRIWLFRDITDRKRSEGALRQLSVAVEQSPVSVVITDLKGTVTYVNRRFTESSGYSYKEVCGQSASMLESDHNEPTVFQQLWDTITRGQEWRGELCSRRKSGELYWESVVVSPIRDERGDTSHFLAVKEDVTERKAMETQLRQAQKLEAIGQLAAGIAHEINTPIQFVGDNTRFVQKAWASFDQAISLLESVPEPSALTTTWTQLNGILEACDSSYLRQEIPRALDQSLEGISRVAKIVQAMKEFSHPGSEEKQLVDIKKAILTTLTVARNEWKYVADVETFIPEDLARVPCHGGELNQALLNLVINSAQAIATVVADGAKGNITVRATQNDFFTTIAIQDTGSGIPDEIQAKVFDPFFTTKPVGKGTGQGLSLAYNSIVNRHGGKIWFETEVGKGTTFYIQLPMT